MTRSSGFKFVFSIFSIILSLLLIVSIFKFCFSNTTFSFSSFFNWISNVNSVSINFSISNFYIYGDWGLFDFLRNFFNIFAQLLSVLVYLGTQFINLIIFVGQFIGFLFT